MNDVVNPSIPPGEFADRLRAAVAAEAGERGLVEDAGRAIDWASAHLPQILKVLGDLGALAGPRA